MLAFLPVLRSETGKKSARCGRRLSTLCSIFWVLEPQNLISSNGAGRGGGFLFRGRREQKPAFPPCPCRPAASSQPKGLHQKRASYEARNELEEPGRRDGGRSVASTVCHETPPQKNAAIWPFFLAISELSFGYIYIYIFFFSSFFFSYHLATWSPA